MKSSRQAFWIVGLTAVALLAWTGLRPWLPRSELAENNFQANLIRIQAWKLDPHPPVVLVGSSLTGRLLPSYFEESPLGNAEESDQSAGTASSSKIANLGLDGSGPEAGLRLLLDEATHGRLPRVVLIEGHRLAKIWNANDDLLMKTATSLSITVAGVVPGLRADTRPSSLLYYFLKRRSTGGGTSAVPNDTVPAGEVPEPGWDNRLKDLVDQLRAKNVRVLIYRLPAGRENLSSDSTEDLIEDIARKWNLPYLNVARECGRRDLHLTYSDGLHLTPGSARDVVAVMTELTRAVLSH